MSLADRTLGALYEQLLEAMGPDALLNELMQAMSGQEALENLQHIADMHGM